MFNPGPELTGAGSANFFLRQESDIFVDHHCDDINEPADTKNSTGNDPEYSDYYLSAQYAVKP